MAGGVERDGGADRPPPRERTAVWQEGRRQQHVRDPPRRAPHLVYTRPGTAVDRWAVILRFWRFCGDSYRPTASYWC